MEFVSNTSLLVGVGNLWNFNVFGTNVRLVVFGTDKVIGILFTGIVLSFVFTESLPIVFDTVLFNIVLVANLLKAMSQTQFSSLGILFTLAKSLIFQTLSFTN